MLDDGTDRLTEFRSRLSSDLPPQHPPSEFPSPVIEILDQLSLIESTIDSEEDHGFARSKTAAAANKLQRSTLTAAKQAAHQLIELIDDQAVDVAISWEEFVLATRQVIVECRRNIRTELVVPRWTRKVAGTSSVS